MALFGRSTGATLGLACDGTRIRLAEVRHSDAGATVVSLGQTDLPDNVILSGRLNDPQKLASTVSSLMTIVGAKAKDASVNIPNRHATIKRLDVPSDLVENYDDWLSFEAGQFADGDPSEYLVDGHRVRDNPTDRTTDVLMVAVRSAQVQAMVDALRSAGLRPFSADVDSVALANGFERAYPSVQDEVVVLCDVEPSEASVTVMDRGTLSYAAGVRVPEGLLDNADATEFGGELGDYLSALVPAVLPAGAKRGLHRVLVSGTGACAKGFYQAIKASTGAAVEIATPFLSVAVDEKLRRSRDVTDAPYEYCLAVGLAMRTPGGPT